MGQAGAGQYGAVSLPSCVWKGHGDVGPEFPFPIMPTQVRATSRRNPQPSIAMSRYWPFRKQIGLPGHEFIFRLPRGEIHHIDHVVLYNAQADQPERYGELQLYSKDFTVAVSTTQPTRSEFREVVAASWHLTRGRKAFDFPATDARYVRLTIFNGHNPKLDEVQLAEFEIYCTEGVNVGGSKVDQYDSRFGRDLSGAVPRRLAAETTRRPTCTMAPSQAPDGVWSFAGPPPLIIQRPDTNSRRFPAPRFSPTIQVVRSRREVDHHAFRVCQHGRTAESAQPRF